MKNVKVFVTGFLVCALLMGSVIGVMAASDVSIKALLMNTVKMKLYGKDYVPKAANGSYIKPISYNGRIYLPLETIAGAVGVPIENDVKSKTLWIGGKVLSVQVNDKSMYEDYYGSIMTKDLEKLTTADDSYTWGVTNDKPLEMSFFGCYLKPAGKYKRFTASIFMDQEVKQDLVIEFRNGSYNGEVIRSITLKPGETKKVDFDIGDVQKFCIISTINIGHDKVSKLVIGEPMFTNLKK